MITARTWCAIVALSAGVLWGMYTLILPRDPIGAMGQMAIGLFVAELVRPSLDALRMEEKRRMEENGHG